MRAAPEFPMPAIWDISPNSKLLIAVIALVSDPKCETSFPDRAGPIPGMSTSFCSGFAIGSYEKARVNNSTRDFLTAICSPEIRD